MLGLVLLLATGLCLGFADSSADPWVWLALAGGVRWASGWRDTLMFEGPLADRRVAPGHRGHHLQITTVVVLSWWLLDERLSARGCLGGALILGAVALASFVPGTDLPISHRASRAEAPLYSGIAVMLMGPGHRAGEAHRGGPRTPVVHHRARVWRHDRNGRARSS